MDFKPRDFGSQQVAMLSDLGRIVMSELELRAVAMLDGLTGALSRRAFRDEATRAIALAIRHKHDLSCMIFDLDHFKAINDGHGHGIGDLVLSAAVDACRGVLRDADALGRIGGEEFAVLLPYTNRDDAMHVAEKVRAAIAGLVVRGKTGPVRVSASFGVASLERGARDLDELLRRADSALYAAKGAGRNACMAWQEAEPVHTDIRHRVFKPGQISFNAERPMMSCTVRGLSDAGASIDVFGAADIPEQFRLKIPAGDFSRACRIETRHDKHLEVAFE